MVDYDSNIIKKLQEQLIQYIITFEPDAKDLDKMSYMELIEKYRNLLCLKSDFALFDNIIANYVEAYRSNDLDTTLTDHEIILADNILNPANFIGLLSKKIIAIEKKLESFENGKDFLEDNSYRFYDKKIIYEKMHKGTAKNVSIYVNYLAKCRRIMKIIEEEYIQKYSR